MSFSAPASSYVPPPQAPQAPAPPPVFGQQQTAQPKQKQAQGFTPTFLGGANPTNTGQKTLLGA